MQGGIIAKTDDEDALAITDPQDASYTVGNNTYRIKEVWPWRCTVVRACLAGLCCIQPNNMRRQHRM